MRILDAACPDPEWDAFVRSRPDATFFHLSGWRRVVADVFGHRCRNLALRDGAELAAALPLVEIRSRLFGHALISNAFCVGGGPLAVDAAARDAILEEAGRLARELGADYVELRDAPSAPAGWRARDDLYAGFEGPIPAAEADNLKQIPRKQRAVVRKALEAGFEVAIERSAEPFFSLYSGTMRNHGTPALPKPFFQELLRVFGEDCEILTVRRDGRPISSVLSYYFRDRVLPYYTGGAEEARATGANDMMYWSLMRRAAGRGCAVFDFGRSKLGTGPYNFKRNWGFEPRPIVHQYYLARAQELPNVNPTNPRYRLFIEAWRRLPLPLANAISPFLSRSLG
ncbi:MAG TPA: FemAB family XrtA/PEP-CTERM system-associated protein [Rhizomicrobium sp.]|jgi:FemAB-related protein (PEP-CTERM system-associated)|nr:FemAB family XrtA/PEP-CTERM system-associated protein [Rhizomicrobium sp.]